jgi:hypothetical protein
VERNVELHFFAAHHGQSACDGSAAHLKKLIRSALLDGLYPNTPQDICNIALKVKGVSSAELVNSIDVPEIATFKTIRSYHMFRFAPNGKVQAYIYVHWTLFSPKKQPSNLENLVQHAIACLSNHHYYYW